MKKSSKVLWSEKSKYQSIKLVRDSRGMLFQLNGSPQVHSREEVLYHENVATLPMMLAQRVDHCVILGGGDGLAARNILRFPGVKSLHLVELDSAVTDLWSKREDLARMNEGSLRNPRLKLVIGDAIQWMLKAQGPFDIIISDVAVSYTKQPRAMTLRRYLEYFQAISKKLSPGGVAVITTADDESDEEVVQGFFKQFGQMMSPQKREAFVRADNIFTRTRLLTEIIFPYSLQWNINLKALGPHATYYLSNKPMTCFRRFPKPSAKFIRKDYFRTTLNGKN